MKINLLQVPKDYEGKPIKDEKGKDALLRDIFSIALNFSLKDEVITAEQKSKIFQLSIKLYQNKEADLTLDERALIKERVGKVHGSLIYGRVCEVLEETK